MGRISYFLLSPCDIYSWSSKSCCEGFGLFPSELKDSAGDVSPVPRAAAWHGQSQDTQHCSGLILQIQESCLACRKPPAPRWMSWKTKPISAGSSHLYFGNKPFLCSARHCCCATWFWASHFSPLLLSSFAVALPSVASSAQGLLYHVFTWFEEGNNG